MKKASDTPNVCEFCRFATEIHAMDDMLCTHKGAVDKDYSCRKFRYDPLKRVPKKLPELPTLDMEE